MDLAEDDQERIYRLLEWRSLARISVAGSPSCEGMGDDVNDDILDSQVRWWLEHGSTVGAMIFAAFVAGVVFLLAVMR